MNVTPRACLPDEDAAVRPRTDFRVRSQPGIQIQCPSIFPTVWQVAAMLPIYPPPLRPFPPLTPTIIMQKSAQTANANINAEDLLRDARREIAALRRQLEHTKDDCATQVRLLEEDLRATRLERGNVPHASSRPPFPGDGCVRATISSDRSRTLLIQVHGFSRDSERIRRVREAMRMQTRL
ncbi:hypothetical protein BV25DRAFT_442794 [Artomyces pyxidatus]|uniref:Uncharacterized protein n=1 Tax=Artomyces pyxidatus TaxID=48021 RepID=A0ACB8T530_9AGAM|nr:hypothetical protein BV25DRAFT_442794 [Artomyces pyxidatus]